jgi:hypothetical protein
LMFAILSKRRGEKFFILDFGIDLSLVLDMKLLI